MRGDNTFELTQNGINLSPSAEKQLYFDLQLKLDPMLDKVVFKVDPENPPSTLEQSIGIGVGYSMIESIREVAKMESVVFQITGTDDDLVKASGRIDMKEKNGHSMVESLSFGHGAILFLTDYF